MNKKEDRIIEEQEMIIDKKKIEKYIISQKKIDYDQTKKNNSFFANFGWN